MDTAKELSHLLGQAKAASERLSTNIQSLQNITKRFNEALEADQSKRWTILETVYANLHEASKGYSSLE
jgi:hypothetical protein